MDLKDCYIGQVVRFRDFDVLMKLELKDKVRFHFNRRMKPLCGKLLTIKDIFGDGRIEFEEEEDDDFYMNERTKWSISADMIEEIVNEEAMLQISGDDELLQMLLA